MAVLSIMMMFSFAAAEECTGALTNCTAAVCCDEQVVTVYGACSLGTGAESTCRDNKCADSSALSLCEAFSTLNEKLAGTDLKEVLISGTNHMDNKMMMTKLMTDDIAAAVKKSIMSPADHSAVAEFQQGMLVCPAADGATDGEGEAGAGICESKTCCTVPTLSSCSKDMCDDCKYFCMENQTAIIEAYAKVTNLSAIIVLQQQNLSFVNGTDATNLGALLEGLSDEQTTMLADMNPFFGNAATLGSFALVLAMVVNF